MKIKIKDYQFDLHYTMRMMVIYENITGESVDFTNMESIKQLTTLFLACIIASAKKAKIDLNMSYDDFIDWLDDNGGYVILNEFALWLAAEMDAKYGLLKKEEEKEADLPKSTKKEKN